jgi:hypothetical protein
MSPEPFPDVRFVPNPDGTTRGHVEREDDDGVFCEACGNARPERGGWSEACETATGRSFMGG